MQTSAIASASAARAGRSFSHQCMAAEIGSCGQAFQLSFRQIGRRADGPRPAYFAGILSTPEQTVFSSASLSEPVAFFGASERQLGASASGLDGV
ncbi:MAG: hypothetical protein JWP50_788 [Phenylobacterium sp.]|nr:hypothetical protein [Phenylobacterium sp.]